MESTNDNKITPTPSSPPSSSSSSSNSSQAAAFEIEGTSNTDPQASHTPTDPTDITSSEDKDLSPKKAQSTTADPLPVDVTDSVAISENANVINPSPTGSFVDASFTVDDLLDNDPAETTSPPTQVMERPSVDDTASPSGYRIPDYVFARKPSAFNEWSANSNESLFSIQMGMSFTRDHFSYLGKSGELGLMPEEHNLSHIDFSSNQPPDKQVKSSHNTVGSDDEPNLRVTEAKAAEIMRQVLMESAEYDSKGSPISKEGKSNRGSPSPVAENQSKGSSTSRIPNHSANPSLMNNNFNSTSSVSHTSSGSTKSFAFPILSGAEDRSGSLTMSGLGKHKQQHSPRDQSPKNQTSPRKDSRPQTPPRESTTPTAASPQPSNPAPPTPVFFSVKAYIGLIKPVQTLWYWACKVCNKKMTEAVGGDYWCEGCQKYDKECSLRYILLARAMDASSDVYLSMFNNEAEKVIGCSADELDKMKSEDENLYLQTLKQAAWVPHLFRVSVVQNEYNDQKRQRVTARAVAPLDFSAESKFLLEDISKMKAS